MSDETRTEEANPFIMTEELKQELALEIMKKTRAQLIESQVDRNMYRMNRIMDEKMEKVIGDFLATEVVPIWKQWLEENRDAIVTAGIQGVQGIVELLVTAMISAARENLNKSWEREKILKALFA